MTLIAYIRAQPTIAAPIVPSTWEVVPEAGRWSTVYPLGRGGPFFHARLIARGTPATRALFVCTGSAQVLARLTAAIAADGLPWTQSWPTLAALRSDAGTLATAIKAAWPDERPHAWTGPIGARVDGGPLGQLVALYSRMAGFDGLDGE